MGSLSFPVCAQGTGPLASGSLPGDTSEPRELGSDATGGATRALPHAPPCTLACVLQRPQPSDLALSSFSLFLSSWQEQGSKDRALQFLSLSDPEGVAVAWDHPLHNVLS